jgi:hypothetical protein
LTKGVTAPCGARQTEQKSRRDGGTGKQGLPEVTPEKYFSSAQRFPKALWYKIPGATSWRNNNF